MDTGVVRTRTQYTVLTHTQHAAHLANNENFVFHMAVGAFGDIGFQAMRRKKNKSSLRRVDSLASVSQVNARSTCDPRSTSFTSAKLQVGQSGPINRTATEDRSRLKVANCVRRSEAWLELRYLIQPHKDDQTRTDCTSHVAHGDFAWSMFGELPEHATCQSTQPLSI